MSSPLFKEVEAVAAPSALDSVTTNETKGKVSSLRKWGPAMIAVFLVLLLNAAMFSNGTPEMSERAQRKLKLASERTAFVEAMEPVSDFKSTRGFGSRDLSEEEGGVMEYTRRRHRT
jgi:hypothetical protein